MKICMLSNLFAPVVSGSATQCEGLARALAAQGHEVLVITARLSPDAPEQATEGGVTIHRLPAVRLPAMGIALNFPWLSVTQTPANRRRLRALVERHGAEVIHVHNHMFDLALGGAAVSRALGVPMVVTLHTIIRHPNRAYDLLLRLPDRLLLGPRVLAQASAVVCPDVNVQAYLRSRFGREGEIIPYGVQLDPAADDEVERARDEFGLRGKRVVLSVGHVHALRNRADLLRAFPRVVAAVPEATLVIVGDVADPSPVRLARSLGLNGHVVFTGAQPRRQVSALLGLAELEAHWLNQDEPSRTSLGVASLEAMSLGRTILAAANVDSYGPGVLQSGENLVIVEAGRPEALAQELIGLLDDDARRARIGANARRTVSERFSWSAVAARTAALYASVRGPRGR
ncbi:MAG: glycosyltransferase family 4 protein [Planctomycetes bacterium]|nr:glycosyltransferase family 4 protein [Planctomycetota bacterium]